jgi:hypothetical protein
MSGKGKAKNKRNRNRKMKNVEKQLRKDFSFLNGNTVSLSLLGKKKRKSLMSKAMKEHVAPVARGFEISTTPASIVSSLNKTKIKHREYVADIIGTLPFEGNAFVINPGNGMLFPWLSQIAQRYESYLFNKLEFHYVTTSPTGTAGSVIYVVIYDSNASLPSEKVQALSMESTVRTQPWDCMTHASKIHNLRKRSSYYIRNGTDDVVDSELYDVGVFMAMTEGLNSEFVDGAVGELHVEYDVDLITPVLTNSTSSVTGVSGVVQGTYSDATAKSAWSRPYLTYDPTTNLPEDLPVSGGNVLAVCNGGAQAGNFTVRLFDFFQPGIYLLDCVIAVDGHGQTIFNPGDPNLGYYSTNASANLISSVYDVSALTAQVALLFAVRFDGAGSSGQPFGSFGFGFNVTDPNNGTTAVTEVFISPWSNISTVFGPLGTLDGRTKSLKWRAAKRSSRQNPLRVASAAVPIPKRRLPGELPGLPSPILHGGDTISRKATADTQQSEEKRNEENHHACPSDDDFLAEIREMRELIFAMKAAQVGVKPTQG